MHDGLVSFHASLKLLQQVQLCYPDRSIYQDQVQLVRPCFRDQGECMIDLPTPLTPEGVLTRATPPYSHSSS